MKKRIALILAVSASLPALAHVDIQNRTPYTIRYSVHYKLCRPLEGQLAPHSPDQILRVQKRGCCPTVVKFTHINSGKTKTWEPPATGFGLSCRNSEVTVTEPEPGYQLFTTGIAKPRGDARLLKILVMYESDKLGETPA